MHNSINWWISFSKVYTARAEIILTSIFLLLFTSCWNNSKYQGYNKTNTGLYYKLQAIGDGKRKPFPGDFLQLIITYKTLKDSVFYDTFSSNETGMVILPFNRSSFSGSFEEGLKKMNAGDSVSFIVNADSLFKKFFKAELPIFLEHGSSIKMDVKLYSILTKVEYEKELEKFEQIVENRDIEESRKLQIYLDTNKTKYYPIANGMYYMPVIQGVGNFARYGDKVTIHYKGFFLNGKQFESTYERSQALEFNFGEDGQVINGFKTAISLMNQGAKTKFIIPSQLAFGETGSSTNIVPPYTTLIYEIELINLTSYNN